MSLNAALDGLAGLVAAGGYPTHDHVPDRLTPPVVLVVGADPYIEPGDTFTDAELTVNVELHLIAGHARNRKATGDLNAMIDAVLATLTGSPWVFDTVSPHFVGRVDDREFLAARITTHTEYERTNTP